MIDLQKYCYTADGHPYLRKPFSRGDWTYATNGHICIRVQRRSDVPEVNDAPQEEDMARIFSHNPEGATYILVCELQNMPEETKCEACDGRGYYHDCPDCDCECKTCDSWGVLNRINASVEINSVAFDALYIKWLLDLPGVKFPTNLHKYEAMCGVFDGGSWALMSMREHKENKIPAILEPKP